MAQLLNQTNWPGAQIAKVYGVSDSVINGQGDQQSSIEMMSNQYVKALSRFAKPIVSELNNKLNANISLDLRSAIDPLGDSYASTIASLQKQGTLGANQASWLLQQTGYLPDDMPDKEKPTAQVQPVQVVPTKGGEDDGEDSDQGSSSQQ